MRRITTHPNFNSDCRKVLFVAVSAVMVICTACQQRTGIDSPNVSNQDKAQSIQPGRDLPSPNSSPLTDGEREIIPYTFMNNAAYVPADDLVKTLHLNGAWSDDKTTYMIGDTGVDTVLMAGSTSVSHGDQTVNLSAPPIQSNQKLYITVQDAMRLFGDFANLKTGEAKDGLVIYPAEQNSLVQQIQKENEPNFTMDTVHAESIRSASSVAQKIIATGERYMGVPYKFGAKTGDTSSFDCSSFVQTIYHMYGIQVPRLAGKQSHAGVYVARENLKPGDLVFFYKVPQMHVAIYIGNGKILHTWGKPGVTISNFNSGWWHNHFTTARRVI